MARSADSFDESDVRIRPPRSSRPRTKDRPSHEKAVTGFVINVDRGRITCLLDTPGSALVITAMKARELGKKSVVVGDLALLVGDLTGGEGTLARVVGVEPRRNQLTRTIDDASGGLTANLERRPDRVEKSLERQLVANVDQVAIVTAAANPEPRRGFIDRALVAAYDQGITPIIVITKCDLADPTEFLRPYESLGVKILRISRERELDELQQSLADKVTVLIGHSGVGKSTLVNRLVGSDARLTGDVNDVTGRGRHTSSSAAALALEQPISGWIIDTPGVRSFGLAHVERDRVVHAFPEFREAVAHCPRNCSHDEPECALNHWEFNELATERLANLRSLLSERY
jgi:ribosome biogenesis GTPase